MTELPSWSGQAMEGESHQRQPDQQKENQDERESRRSGLVTGLVIGLLVGLLLAGFGAGAFWLGRQQANDVAATDNAEEPPAAAGSDGLSSEVAEGDDQGTASTVDAGSTTETESDADDEDTTDSTTDSASTESDEDGPGVEDGELLVPEGYVSTDPNYDDRIQLATEYAVVRGGKVFLYGFAQTQADLENSIAVTAAVMGPDGYVVERFVDPDTPLVDGAPIFVDDKVLFGFNSTELDPDSLPILDLGAALMLQNPTAEMLIIARSDAIGSAETNLEVSARRGQAVIDYWASQGVEPSRMQVDARGEADASEDDAPDVAALNRSVEFVVSGIPNG